MPYEKEGERKKKQKKKTEIGIGILRLLDYEIITNEYDDTHEIFH